jgi:hypothetical protein
MSSSSSFHPYYHHHLPTSATVDCATSSTTTTTTTIGTNTSAFSIDSILAAGTSRVYPQLAYVGLQRLAAAAGPSSIGAGAFDFMHNPWTSAAALYSRANAIQFMGNICKF